VFVAQTLGNNGYLPSKKGRTRVTAAERRVMTDQEITITIMEKVRVVFAMLADSLN